MLRIFLDDFHQKVKNIHHETKKHYSYKRKRVSLILKHSVIKKNGLIIAIIAINAFNVDIQVKNTQVKNTQVTKRKRA